MDFTGDDGLPQRTTGVIGALGLGHEPGEVMPHERTLPKAKTDRLELLRATRANLDPIWGLSLATGLSTLLAQAHADLPDAPFATATDEDGFHHSLWRITDPERIEAIRAAVVGARLVLADGHHRFETATTYRAERRAAGIDDPGADAIMMLVVELAPGQLCVRAIHRLLDGVGGVDLRAALGRPVPGRRDAGPNAPEGVAALENAMRDERRARPRRPRRARAAAPGRRSWRPAWTRSPSELRDVDSARFDAGVLPAVPGVTLAYRNDAADRRRAGREGRRRRRGAAAPGHRRHHPRRGRGRSAHAGEDHVLRARSRAPAWCSAASTTDGAECAGSRSTATPSRPPGTAPLHLLVDVPGGAGADAACRGRRDPDAPTAFTSWRCTSAS